MSLNIEITKSYLIKINRKYNIYCKHYYKIILSWTLAKKIGGIVIENQIKQNKFEGERHAFLNIS